MFTLGYFKSIRSTRCPYLCSGFSFGNVFGRAVSVDLFVYEWHTRLLLIYCGVTCSILLPFAGARRMSSLFGHTWGIRISVLGWAGVVALGWAGVSFLFFSFLFFLFQNAACWQPFTQHLHLPGVPFGELSRVHTMQFHYICFNRCFSLASQA